MERERCSSSGQRRYPLKSMYGLDISEQAVQAARENSRRAGTTIHVVHRNFNDFKHEYKFDEILTDMPRTENLRQRDSASYLYELLFTRGRELLAPQGIMVVYSEDGKLMEKKISRKFLDTSDSENSYGKGSYILVVYFTK